MGYLVLSERAFPQMIPISAGCRSGGPAINPRHLNCSARENLAGGRHLEEYVQVYILWEFSQVVVSSFSPIPSFFLSSS
jgi:hypothetical protein